MPDPTDTPKTKPVTWMQIAHHHKGRLSSRKHAFLSAYCESTACGVIAEYADSPVGRVARCKRCVRVVRTVKP